MARSAARKARNSRTRRLATRNVGSTKKRPPVSRKTTRKRRVKKAVAATPGVIPMISYEDGIAALEWLHRAFGFEETARHVTPDGRLSHGEMTAGDGLVMLASPTPDYHGPKRHREVCEYARKWSTVPWIIDGVLVLVNKLDEHFARAKAAGATILSNIESDPPGRRYRAEDLEGHRWFFIEQS